MIVVVNWRHGLNVLLGSHEREPGEDGDGAAPILLRLDLLAAPVLAFSRQLHLFASSFDYFIALFRSFVIGQTNDFGFGASTLNGKPLSKQQKFVCFPSVGIWRAVNHCH